MQEHRQEHRVEIILTWKSDSHREDVDADTLETMRTPLEDIVRDLLDWDADNIAVSVKVKA